MRSSWLYLAMRSERDSEPVLIWPALVPIGSRTGALLLAADEDVARFGEDLPTEWIVRMAEAVGAVLSRVMGYR